MLYQEFTVAEYTKTFKIAKPREAPKQDGYQGLFKKHSHSNLIYNTLKVSERWAENFQNLLNEPRPHKVRKNWKARCKKYTQTKWAKLCQNGTQQSYCPGCNSSWAPQSFERGGTRTADWIHVHRYSRDMAFQLYHIDFQEQSDHFSSDKCVALLYQTMKLWAHNWSKITSYNWPINQPVRLQIGAETRVRFSRLWSWCKNCVRSIKTWMKSM